DDHSAVAECHHRVAVACKPFNSVGPLAGAEPELELLAQRESPAVQLQRGAWPRSLNIASKPRPLGRLGQPALTGGAEAEPGGVRLPGNRHPASVAPITLTVGAEPGG